MRDSGSDGQRCALLNQIFIEHHLGAQLFNALH